MQLQIVLSYTTIVCDRDDPLTVMTGRIVASLTTEKAHTLWTLENQLHRVCLWVPHELDGPNRGGTMND